MPAQVEVVAEPIEQAAADIDIRLFPRQALAYSSPANEILFGGAKGGGKLLDVNEILPTPNGWTRNGDIEIGDHVIGEDGQSTAVIAVSELIADENAYRLTLSDGTSIIAGESHLWKTLTANDRSAEWRRTDEFRARRRSSRASRATTCTGGKGTGKGRKAKPWLAERNRLNPPKSKPRPEAGIKTTKEIYDSLYIRNGAVVNHSIANHACIELPETEVLIPPYTLGAWLGDGTTKNSQITGVDREIWENIEADGFTVTHHKTPKSHWIKGFAALARAAGVLGDKHIPVTYMRSSIEQRVALLQGLMDTDGWCEKDGSCQLSLTKKKLFDDAVELIRTLGITVNVTTGITTATNGTDGNKCEYWKACFVTPLPVFRLRRKLERQNRAPHIRYTRRFIVACESLGPRLMRCIQVTNSDGMYLAGRSFIPTHNSGLIRLSNILWCMMAPGLQCALFRRSYRELQDNHMEGAKSFPDVLAKMSMKGMASVTAHDIRFWNGSHISLNHLQYKKDVYKHSGRQIHVLDWDEATQFEPEQYTFLTYSVMRLGGWQPPAHMRGMFPRALSGANPGGPGHHFFKEGFVDNGPYVITQMPKEQGGMRRQFIPSRAEDNPALLANDPEYLDRLEGSGDVALVRALREGDWEVVAGSMYGDVFRRTLHGRPWHVHPGFRIPESWPLWRGGDDGYENPSAIYWGAEDPERGTIYVIDELYQDGLLADELAFRILERDMAIPMQDRWGNPIFNKEKLKGSYDSNAFADTGTGTSKKDEKAITRGEQMNKMGCRWEPIEKWPGSRAASAQNLHKLMAPNKRAPLMLDENGAVILDKKGRKLHDRPGLVFFARCVNAIKHIPALARDEKDPEDVEQGQKDTHCFIAGTKIKTSSGETLIEELRVGDKVWTRKGLKRITKIHPPRVADTVTVGFSNGTQLTGTATHPVWTKERGWIGLYFMTETDTIGAWMNQSSLAKLSNNFAGKVIIYAANTFRKIRSGCMSPYGRKRTVERFRQDTMFTTRTKIAHIIGAITSTRCLNSIIYRFMGKKLQPLSGKHEAETRALHLSGTRKYQRANAGQQVEQGGSSENLSKLSARNAPNSFQHSDLQSPNFAAERASSEIRAVAKKRNVRKETVFNITVEGTPEYYANGILVHNCYDGVRYLVQHRRGKTKIVTIGGI